MSYPTPESTGISGVVGNPSPTPDTEQYSMGEHCLPLFENLEVKKFLADLGVRELDDFELRGMSKGKPCRTWEIEAHRNPHHVSTRCVSTLPTSRSIAR